MRRIDPTRFHIARRRTSREINRQIALTLIRSHQPISRAELARFMKLPRAVVGRLVNELLLEDHLVERPCSRIRVGRRPTMLSIDIHQRTSVAVDVRATGTFLMLADVIGRPYSDVRVAPTPRSPKRFVQHLVQRIVDIIEEFSPNVGTCQGIGVVVPGMVDHVTGRVLQAPTLGWRNVDIRGPLTELLDLPVHIENSGRACALAQAWEAQSHAARVRDLVYVSVSDGVGVGVIVNGELVRGRNNMAGEFAHMPLGFNGPRCSCGARGCWEAYISNLATVSRYGRAGASRNRGRRLTVTDVIARAREGDHRALTALETTARYLGLGLAGIAHTINPASIYIGGEITTAWDLIGDVVQQTLAERALVPKWSLTSLINVTTGEQPRLRGAAMLVAAPVFAAPAVA
jgi:predicted NBD/HSP70 family sugar kinase